MHKVRFNLGKGDNYMKWKITYPDGRVDYHEPSEVTIAMLNAKLKNRRSTAEKIHQGAHKTVCAWIECEEVMVVNALQQVESTKKVSYNPRVQPYWIDDDGVDIDNQSFGVLVTKENEVFISYS